jgi:hypothetical protein
LESEAILRIRTQEIELPPDLIDLIRARLTSGTDRLPALHHDETPVDIFVDLASLYEDWRRELLRAVPELLSKEIENVSPEPVQTYFLGELCYLAARIGCLDALPMLRALVADERAVGSLRETETLRLRALRSMVGLLGAYARDTAPVVYLKESLDYRVPDIWVPYRATMFYALSDPSLAVVALTGLIGLWPRERAFFLRSTPADIEGGEYLEIALKLAFPRRPLRGPDPKDASRDFRER